MLRSSCVTVRGHRVPQVAALFDSGKEVYRGYVDDPRNTDNAWTETTAFHFHC